MQRCFGSVGLEWEKSAGPPAEMEDDVAPEHSGSVVRGSEALVMKCRALIIRMGFWGPLYYTFIKEPQKSIGNCLGPFSTPCTDTQQSRMFSS